MPEHQLSQKTNFFLYLVESFSLNPGQLQISSAFKPLILYAPSHEPETPRTASTTTVPLLLISTAQAPHIAAQLASPGSPLADSGPQIWG